MGRRKGGRSKLLIAIGVIAILCIAGIVLIGGGDDIINTNSEPFLFTVGSSSEENADRIDKNSDGTYYFAGSTASFGIGMKDLYLAKMDGNGSIIWARTYGSIADECPDPEVAASTSDGGFVLAGRMVAAGLTTRTCSAADDLDFKDLDWTIVKFDSNGNTQWKRTIIAAGDEWLYTLHQSPDGGYVMGGWTINSFPNTVGKDFLIVKLDANGVVQWIKTIGGTAAGADEGYSLRSTSDGGLIMTGFTQSMGKGGGDFLVVRMDSSGAIQWSKTYGSVGLEMPKSIRQTSDGGYIVAGRTSASQIDPDAGCSPSDPTTECNFGVLKLDSAGNMQWFRMIGGTAHDFGWSVRQHKDGGYLVGGFTYSFGVSGQNGLLVKLKPDGSTEWARAFGGTSADAIFSIADRHDSDGGFAVAGWSFSKSAGGRDAWIMNLEPDGTAEAYCGTGKLGSTDITVSISNTVVTANMVAQAVSPQTTSPGTIVIDSTIGTVTTIPPASIVVKNACP